MRLVLLIRLLMNCLQDVDQVLLANRLVEFLMRNAFYPNRSVLRNNIEIIKTVVELWKSHIEIPYRYYT